MCFFFAIALCFAIFQHNPTHSTSTTLPNNFHLWWWCSKFQGGVAANCADLRSKLIFLRQWKHPAGLEGKRQGCWPRSAQFQGQWERFHKKIHHLSWMRRFVHTPAYHSRRTTSRLYEFKEDYVKILWRNQFELPKCLKYHKHILQIQDPKDRYSWVVWRDLFTRLTEKKIKLTNAPLDYHQSSCQDSIWFIIIYNLNNYIKIHYSIDSYCECTLSRIYLWMCNHYPMSNWHWNILQKSDVNSHESLPQWAPKKCCYPWNSVYVISKYVKVHV